MRFNSIFGTLALASLASAGTIAAEKRKNVDRADPANLDHCPGHKTGDADKCTFESQSPQPDTTIPHIVGDPIGNCQGGTTNTTSTVGGSTSVSQTWKYGVSVGFSADGGEELPIGASFESSDSWSKTDAKTFTQMQTITIPPGKQAVVIAQVKHKVFLGRIRLNYGDPSGDPGKNDYHYVWYDDGVASVQPTDDVQYGQKFFDCNEQVKV
ncbi:hypothetical protein FB451DRAFT_1247261 [Mycena latifolia]|nr:hypothetical protein FB451DRAFT_1247261 [Mycena latifolia]